MLCEDNSIKITSEWTAGPQTTLMMNTMSGLAAPSMIWYNTQWNKKATTQLLLLQMLLKLTKR